LLHFLQHRAAYIFKWRAAFEVDNRVAEKYLCIQVYLLENRQRKQEKCCFARHQMANTLSAFQINFLKPTPRQRQIKKLTLFHYSLHFGSAASHIDLRALFPILCFILSHRDAGLVALNKGGPEYSKTKFMAWSSGINLCHRDIETLMHIANRN
jgi:hypothetical protein